MSIEKIGGQVFTDTTRSSEEPKQKSPKGTGYSSADVISKAQDKNDLYNLDLKVALRPDTGPKKLGTDDCRQTQSCGTCDCRQTQDCYGTQKGC